MTITEMQTELKDLEQALRVAANSDVALSDIEDLQNAIEWLSTDIMEYTEFVRCEEEYNPDWDEMYNETDGTMEIRFGA